MLTNAPEKAMTFLFWMLIDGVPAFMIEPVLWSEFAADDAERPWRRECQKSALHTGHSSLLDFITHPRGKVWGQGSGRVGGVHPVATHIRDKSNSSGCREQRWVLVVSSLISGRLRGRLTTFSIKSGCAHANDCIRTSFAMPIMELY